MSIAPFISSHNPLLILWLLLVLHFFISGWNYQINIIDDDKDSWLQMLWPGVDHTDIKLLTCIRDDLPTQNKIRTYFFLLIQIILLNQSVRFIQNKVLCNIPHYFVVKTIFDNDQYRNQNLQTTKLLGFLFYILLR